MQLCFGAGFSGCGVVLLDTDSLFLLARHALMQDYMSQG